MVNEVSCYRNLESRGNVAGCMRTGRLPRHTYGHLLFLRKYSRAALSFADRRSTRARKAEVQLNSHQNESESVVKARGGGGGIGILSKSLNIISNMISLQRVNFIPCAIITLVLFERVKTATSSFFLSSLLVHYEILAGKEESRNSQVVYSAIYTTRKAIIDDDYSAWRPSVNVGCCVLLK